MSLASVTELEVHITAQGFRLRNDLYCVEWDVKLYHTVSYHTTQSGSIYYSTGGPNLT